MQASKCNLPNEVMSVCSNGLHSSGREVGTQATQNGTVGNQVPPRNPQVTWKVSLGKTLMLNPRKLPDPSNSSENFKGHPEMPCEADSVDCLWGQVACFLYWWTRESLEKERRGKLTGNLGGIWTKAVCFLFGACLEKKQLCKSVSRPPRNTE